MQNPATGAGLNRVRLFSHSSNTTTRNRKNHNCQKQPLIFIKFPIQFSDQSDSYTSVKSFDLFDAHLNGIVTSSELCILGTDCSLLKRSLAIFILVIFYFKEKKNRVLSVKTNRSVV